MSAETNFTEAVANFPHGNRYDLYLSVVRKGLIALNGDETAVFNYIMTNAPTPSPNPAKIRKAIRYAIDHPLPDQPFTPTRQGGAFLTAQERAEARRLLLPKSARDFVPVTLRNYGRTPFDKGGAFTGSTTATIFGEIIRLPEELHFDHEDNSKPVNPAKIAAIELRALFRPGDLIWAGSFEVGADGEKHKTAFDGIPLTWGGGVIEAHQLADRLLKGEIEKIPTHITLNPITGKSCEVPNADGKGTHPSYNCAKTVAAYRHALIEFDDLFDIDAEGIKTPSQDQIDIAAGICDYSFQTELIRVASCHSTGGKSIHTILNIKAQTEDDYTRQLAALADLFASADNPRFRCDLHPFQNHATLCRLAGATRPETGRRARLLWSNP